MSLFPPPIPQITNLIVSTLHPKRVLLFGSRARNDMHPRSDFDFAVEGKVSPQKWDKLLALLEKNNITLLPIDLVQLETASSPLKNRILKEGIVVYEH